ncbi:hypothetical protein NQ804_04345 [Acinetobacter baumannii]|nr:hypothetical protein [Acinetobacter baumannii]
MDKKIVKEIALANGFKLKEQPDGSLELNPYVYVFADKLVEHQQAKVEELQKQLNEYIFVAETLDEMYVKEVKSSDELQKRVDKAIRLLVEAELYQSEPNIDLAVKALKGEGND